MENTYIIEGARHWDQLQWGESCPSYVCSLEHLKRVMQDWEEKEKQKKLEEKFGNTKY